MGMAEKEKRCEDIDLMSREINIKLAEMEKEMEMEKVNDNI